MTFPGFRQGGGITAADVMRQLADVTRELGAARGQLADANAKLAAIDVRTEQAARAADDHEGRIRILETFRNKLLGIAVVVSITSGAASGVIGYVLGHLH